MSTPTLKLRDYQHEAVTEVHEAWLNGIQRPAVVLPTGMGKTVIFSAMAVDAVDAGDRPLILVHRDELVKQTVAKLHGAAPGMTVGVIKSERHEIDRDVTVASVQSLSRRDRLSRTSPDLANVIIVDEAHHAAADSYRRVLEHFGCFADKDYPHSPGRAVGFTATMGRSDSRGLGDVWDAVVYTQDILYGIARGHLVDVRGEQIVVNGLDLASVARSGGDYADGSLADALEASGAGEVLAQQYRKLACREDGQLRRGIMFCPTVRCAQSFAADFQRAGVTCRVVVGETPEHEREEIYAQLRTGAIDVISSVGVLTEGFDLPEVEVAVIARPTASQGLYTQMVGRVLRPAPWSGKAEALVLDAVGVSSRLPLACLADLTTSAVRPEPGETFGEAIERQRRDETKKAFKGVRIEGAENFAIDLFHRSSSVWLQTHGGVWFIPTREWTIFLWEHESDGTAKIGKIGRSRRTAGNGYLHDGEAYPMALAMAWAEQAASEMDPMVSDRSRSWRKRKAAPTPAQRAMADLLKIPVLKDTTKAQLSDLISVELASRLLDVAR